MNWHSPQGLMALEGVRVLMGSAQQRDPCARIRTVDTASAEQKRLPTLR